MTSKLIKKDTNYICANCRMRQHPPYQPECKFCHSIFSNYETILLQLFEQEEKDVILSQQQRKD